MLPGESDEDGGWDRSGPTLRLLLHGRGREVCRTAKDGPLGPAA